MESAEIVEWALSHGFEKTGVNAYTAVHEGCDYQIVLRRGEFFLQRLYAGGGKMNHARADIAGISIDEFGMLRDVGLDDLFVRSMWRGAPAPVWFSAEFTAHALETIIPQLEAQIGACVPRP